MSSSSLCWWASFAENRGESKSLVEATPLRQQQQVTVLLSYSAQRQSKISAAATGTWAVLYDLGPPED